jgi:hypothetical protein
MLETTRDCEEQRDFLHGNGHSKILDKSDSGGSSIIRDSETYQKLTEWRVPLIPTGKDSKIIKTLCEVSLELKILIFFSLKTGRYSFSPACLARAAFPTLEESHPMNTVQTRLSNHARQIGKNSPFLIPGQAHSIWYIYEQAAASAASAAQKLF